MDWYYQRHKILLIQFLSELYMLTDKSDNFEATHEFVDRRFEDFETFDSYGGDTLAFLNSGLIAKNSLIDMVKEPVINDETRKMQQEYMERVRRDKERVGDSAAQGKTVVDGVSIDPKFGKKVVKGGIK